MGQRPPYDLKPESGQVAYQIRVQGELDDHWSEWFSGMAIQRDTQSPTTTLTGVVDQSALHGILARIRDLNLKLLSVTRLEATSPDVTSSVTLSPTRSPKGQKGQKGE